MRLVDTNLLVFATNPRADEHDAAKAWLDRSLSGGAPVGFAWLALVAFVRLTTNAALFERPLTSSQAMGQVDDWLSARPARVLHPGARHVEILRDLLEQVGTAGNLTNDAHLAALAIEHRATVMTFDSDFARFPGVRWERPI